MKNPCHKMIDPILAKVFYWDTDLKKYVALKLGYVFEYNKDGYNEVLEFMFPPDTYIQTELNMKKEQPQYYCVFFRDNVRIKTTFFNKLK